MSDRNLEKIVTSWQQSFEGGERVPVGSLFELSIKKFDRGQNFIVNVPNRGSFRCHQKELFDLFALQKSPPEPLLYFASRQGKVVHPLEFFHCAIAAVVHNGYGIVTLEFPESKTFIGTLVLSYRGNFRECKGVQ
jgi:hypothetical protein